MRIVFLSPSGELGGAETALLDMLAAVRQARPDWTMALIAASDGPLLDRARPYARTHSLPFPKAVARLGEWGARRSVSARMRFGAGLLAAAPPVVSYTAHLSRFIADFRPDIIHTNGLKMHLFGARVRRGDSRLVWHFHDYPRARKLTAQLLARHIDRCSAIIANSESVAAQTREVFGTNTPVHAMYNSLDLDRFSPHGPRADLDALSELPPLGPGGLRIGLVGTFARWKGHNVFLDAFARVRSLAKVRGYIVGDSIYQTDASQYSRQELRAMADRLNLGPSMGFTGRVVDVDAILRALDIVVHASIEPEPFGLVIAEAMACGRSVVVSRAGGAAEIAKAGAVFHEPGNSADLAASLTRLIHDASLRTELGTAGREAAARLFSRDRLRSTLIPIYESLARPARS